jgi:hypothetical protein
MASHHTGLSTLASIERTLTAPQTHQASVDSLLAQAVPQPWILHSSELCWWKSAGNCVT